MRKNWKAADATRKWDRNKDGQVDRKEVADRPPNAGGPLRPACPYDHTVPRSPVPAPLVGTGVIRALKELGVKATNEELGEFFDQNMDKDGNGVMDFEVCVCTRGPASGTLTARTRHAHGTPNSGQRCHARCKRERP